LAGGYDEEVFNVLVGEEGFYFWLVAAWALCGLGRRGLVRETKSVWQSIIWTGFEHTMD